MPLVDSLKRINALYHFTDRRNLASMKDLGGIFPRAELEKRGIKISAPGGNQWSFDADARKGLAEYVHLCFRKSHVMEMAARADKRIEEPIFLEINPSVLNYAGVLFTDDVANKGGVVIHSLDKAVAMIDFEVLYSRTDWKNPDIQRRLQQAEKYEILVPRPIPLSMIRNFPNG